MPLGLDWEVCQKLSDQILAEGLFLLQGQIAVKPTDVISREPGNYLVTLNLEAMYIGEAEILASRIRQQFVAKTSTFYKNYSKRVEAQAAVDAFRVRYIGAGIGRKELEEFGIVNAGCSLNKFQRDKRANVECATDHTLWDKVQRQASEIIARGESAALSQEFRPWSESMPAECAGLYIVRDPKGTDIIYVGESSDVKGRYEVHSGRTYFSALRRHVGTDVLGFSLIERNGKAKYFEEDQDRSVTDFLRSCRIACMPVRFGRFELEKRLIHKFHPRLNRKDNAVGAD